MPLQTPPAIQAPAPLPSHVHRTLKEARQALSEFPAGSNHHLLAYLGGTAEQARAADDWTGTLSGAMVRGVREIWIASPGDPESQMLLDRFQIRSMPALLELKMDGKTPAILHARFGPEAEDPAHAFKVIEEPTLEEAKAEAAKLYQDHPELGDPDLLMRFRAAREASLDAAAEEPFRTWLTNVLKISADKEVRAWAATRLSEANAAVKPGETQPLKVFAEHAYESMFAILRPDLPTGRAVRHAQSVEAAFQPFGGIGDIPDEAPFWPAFRKALNTESGIAFSMSIYAIFAPHFKAEDRPWLLNQAAKESAQDSDAWDSGVFWASLDWLIVYGEPKDWTDFQGAVRSSTWSNAFALERSRLDKIPAYWGIPRRVQDLFCEGTTQEAFWKNPESCLTEWGVTREALLALAWDQGKIKSFAPTPAYPEWAKRLRLTNKVRLHLVIDAAGQVRSIRPEPGFALAFFAPEGIKWASKTVFQPTMVAGVPRPGTFAINLNFKLQ